MQQMWCCQCWSRNRWKRSQPWTIKIHEQSSKARFRFRSGQSCQNQESSHWSSTFNQLLCWSSWFDSSGGSDLCPFLRIIIEIFSFYNSYYVLVLINQHSHIAHWSSCIRFYYSKKWKFLFEFLPKLHFLGKCWKLAQ